MSHPEQRALCEWVRDKYPEYFNDVDVLDCGALDINGNNRYLFTNSSYFGIDLCQGPNVSWIGRIHDFPDVNGPFDVIISTEMLEHDEHYQASLRHMMRLLRPGGLLLLTCATHGRPEHGTARTTPTDSPATQDYYRNLDANDIAAIPGFLEHFSTYQFMIEEGHKDLCFYGIKELQS